MEGKITIKDKSGNILFEYSTDNNFSLTDRAQSIIKEEIKQIKEKLWKGK